MIELPWYKKLLSYLIPVTLSTAHSDKHPRLRVKYYHRQLQLESDNALYSDGHRYAPFRLAFDFLDKKNALLPAKNFLLLGAGFGSAVDRLHKIYDFYPEAILVEHDKKIIQLGKEFFSLNNSQNTKFIHADASKYLQDCKQSFDLIGIDLFDNLINSNLIMQDSFLGLIQNTLQTDGHVILNSIFIKKKERNQFEKQLEQFFSFKRLERKPNYIYILKHKK